MWLEMIRTTTVELMGGGERGELRLLGWGVKGSGVGAQMSWEQGTSVLGHEGDGADAGALVGEVVGGGRYSPIF